MTAGLPLLGNVLTFTGMVVVMLVLDPLLALAVVLLLGFVTAALTYGFVRVVRRP